MKIRVIGHPQAVQGFALVGVLGMAAQTEAEITEALDMTLADPDVGLILISSDAARMIRKRFDALQNFGDTPALIEIPIPNEGYESSSILRKMVEEAIGVHHTESEKNG